jgi:hypothetical protein
MTYTEVLAEKSEKFYNGIWKIIHDEDKEIKFLKSLKNPSDSDLVKLVEKEKIVTKLREI